MMNAPFHTVMLIDDNAIDNFIHTRLFHLYQFSERNLVYNNCRPALEYLTKHQNDLSQLPDLIVLDLHLPAMNGLEFLSAFNRLSDLVKSHCRVVILSSCYEGEELLLNFHSEHVWQIIEKPLRLDRLKEMASQGMYAHA